MKPRRELNLELSDAESFAACRTAITRQGWLITSLQHLSICCTKKLKGSFLSMGTVEVSVQLIGLTNASTRIILSTSDNLVSLIPFSGVDVMVDGLAREIIITGENFTEMALHSTATSRYVVINDVPLSVEQIPSLQQMLRMQVQDGSYWYDNYSGAWGVQGGPVTGFIQAGLNLGGSLRSDASNGNTRVYINGRQLHMLDVMGLQQFCPVFPGRYWVDARGNFGYENGPVVGNLWAMAQQSQLSGNSGGAWSARSATGTVGGDGQGGFYYEGKNGTSWSNL